MNKDRYHTYKYASNLSLVQDPFNSWLAGKTLVQDKDSSSIVAWFAEEELAEEFCKLMNEKNKATFFKGPPNCGDSYAN